MKFLLIPCLALSFAAVAVADEKGGWIPLFDGKSLDGWKANDKPGTFALKDGLLIVRGERSHLFYDGPFH